MSAHTQASTESSSLCDLLVERLRVHIPRLECARTKRWCGLFEPGRTRFAYISHRKRSGSVEVWCAGEVLKLKNHGGVPFTPRDRIGGGWEGKFPGRFLLKTARDVDGAVRLLHEVSYRAS